MVKLPKDFKLNIRAFEKMLDLKYLTNSYKLYWFAGLFEEVKEGNQEIDFERIVLRMVAKSWYSIIEYRLNLGSQDKLDQLVIYIYESYYFSKDILEADLLIELRDILINEEINNKVISLQKFVPYRLLSPFYPELVGVADYKKNKMIESLSKEDNRAIYKIEDEKIIINNNWYEYIYENQTIIEGWLKYKLIYFLQKRNPNVPAIPFKLSAPQKRNLRNAKKYWRNILKINSLTDIYTDETITSESKISIDHFIPWSFVLHDELWNLIPTFKEVNSSKSDKLPDLEIFLNEFCDLQYKGFKIALEHSFSKKLLEDYLTLNKNMSLSRGITKDFFSNNLKKTITPLYQIASNQGFMKWELVNVN